MIVGNHAVSHPQNGVVRPADFAPAWWLRNRHLQTIFPNFFRPRPRIVLRRERLELPDGDFTDVEWTLRRKGPIVVVLHGLEGSVRSRYATAILRRIEAYGWRGALLHFRGCSGEPNRTTRSYHSGFTEDFDWFVRELKRREPETPIAALGYSLGGNALLKWLGETDDAPSLIATAVAVSVPFDLAEAGRAIDSGFSKLYQWVLMRRMRRSARRKFAAMAMPVPRPDFARLRTFRQFDDVLTAPLHGFKDADDYYRCCSSRHFLRHIRVPTLILHAADDPFMTPVVIPAPDELSPAVTLELADRGGHVGFVGGTNPLRPRYWLEERIPTHLREYLGGTDELPQSDR